MRDISITPIDHSDQVLLEKMMDEEDGVSNRQEKDGRKRFGLIRYVVETNDWNRKLSSCSRE